MEIRFINGINRVTGSCTWLRHKETNTEILLDCGMIQGESSDDFNNSRDFLFNPKNIKYLFLTHSHLDHCGLIPRLYKEGFNGKIFCSKATAELTKIILNDCAKHQNLYNKKDVEKIRFHCIDSNIGFKFGNLIKLEENLLFCCNRSAHILGSLSYSFSWKDENNKERSILFSGDLGNSFKDNKIEMMLKESHQPHFNIEYMVLESTYGSIENKENYIYSKKINIFKSKLEKFLTSPNLDTLIIPTFSQHRYQEILFDIFYIISNKMISDYVLTYKIKQGIRGDFFSSQNLETKKITKLNRNILKQNCKSIFKELKNKDLEKQDYSIFSDKYKKLPEKSLKNILLFFDETNSDLKEVLKKIIPYKINFYMASPLGNTINKIYSNHIEDKLISKDGNKKNKFFHNNLEKTFDLQNIKSLLNGEKIKLKDFSFFTDESKKKDKTKETKKERKKDKLTKKIILTSSGMCNEGKILNFLEEHLENKRSLLWLTGYQSNGTNGNKLLKLYSEYYNDPLKKQVENLNLGNKTIPLNKININIDVISDLYSGHIFPKDLINNYIFCNYRTGTKLRNSIIFLNHGDNISRENIKNKIIQANENYKSNSNIRYIEEVIIPTNPQNIYDLDTREWKVYVNKNNLILDELKKQTKLLEENNKYLKQLLSNLSLT